MTAPNHETLLEELNRLLDVGEPLLTMLPKKRPGGWMLQIPDNISYEMFWYAYDVAWRAENREQYLNSRSNAAKVNKINLAEWVTFCESGLLGWRAIGMLR